MRSTVGIPLLPAQAVAEGQGGGGCQGENVRALGRETGIPAPTLYNIKNRSNWGWL
jgi:hypothetical protein